MRDHADKDYLRREMAPAAWAVVLVLMLLGAFFGAAGADWWTGSDVISGAINCVVVK